MSDARVRGWLANPWRTPRFLAAYSWLFLGWAIVVEIEGRWPWQPARVRGE